MCSYMTAEGRASAFASAAGERQTPPRSSITSIEVAIYMLISDWERMLVTQ